MVELMNRESFKTLKGTFDDFRMLPDFLCIHQAVLFKTTFQIRAVEYMTKTLSYLTHSIFVESLNQRRQIRHLL